jgi:hypothetical protein
MYFHVRKGLVFTKWKIHNYHGNGQEALYNANEPPWYSRGGSYSSFLNVAGSWEEVLNI